MSGRHEGVQRPIVRGDVIALPMGSRMGTPVLILEVHPDGRLSGVQDDRPASMSADIARDAWIIGHDDALADRASWFAGETVEPVDAPLPPVDSFFGREVGDILISRVAIGSSYAGAPFEVADIRPMSGGRGVRYGVRPYLVPNAAVVSVAAESFERN